MKYDFSAYCNDFWNIMWHWRLKTEGKIVIISHNITVFFTVLKGYFFTLRKKVQKLSLFKRENFCLGTNVYILGANMYILGANMDI